MKNIIIQAGGLGTRLKHNTVNKPKCLVPVNGKPILQYSLEVFSKDKIYIIADYKIDVLKKYVKTFYPKYNITVVEAGGKGTCSGLKRASNLIDNLNPVVLIWSDLIIEEDIQHDDNSDIFLYTTDALTCRYSIEENKIVKKTSDKNGVVGLFTFKNKYILSSIQEDGSLVGDWLQKTTHEIKFKKINNIKEIGTLELLEKNATNIFCRFFNKIEKKEDIIIKTCVDQNYNNVINDEINWYKFLINKNFKHIPKIYLTDPLTMSFVDGVQCHKHNFTYEEKIKILENITNVFNSLHDIERKASNLEDIYDTYVDKTFKRVEKVKDVIPFYEEEKLNINGKILLNPFHEKYLTDFKNNLLEICTKEFTVIHGDPTFSNFLVDKNSLKITLIDPRGSFGKTKIYGDKDYDWGKLYYSLIGNYDSINSKKFTLTIENDKINYSLQSNGWELLEDKFYSLSGVDRRKNLLMNSSIWFSLCGYVIEDYDSILLAFIKGVELWNQTL